MFAKLKPVHILTPNSNTKRSFEIVIVSNLYKKNDASYRQFGSQNIQMRKMFNARTCLISRHVEHIIVWSAKPDIGTAQQRSCKTAEWQDQTSPLLSTHYSFHYSKSLLYKFKRCSKKHCCKQCRFGQV